MKVRTNTANQNEKEKKKKKNTLGWPDSWLGLE
jgi:hypothetical protein